MKRSLHIGEKVKQRVRELRMPVVEFAQKINKSRTVVYHIFSRKSIDSELLKKISEILTYDFFSFYKEYLPGDATSSSELEEPANTFYYDTLKKNYEAKIEALLKEVKYLKEINELLKDQLKIKK